MKKIPSLFQRNYDGDRQVRNEVVPGCEWVIAGDGVGTRKWDGTSCLVQDGQLFKRYDAKRLGNEPAGFIPAADPDPANKHYLGWVPVSDSPSDQYHREAWASFDGPDGTYELIGPKVQGGVEGVPAHVLKRHGADVIDVANRTFDSLYHWLANYPNVEGFVFHHPDGRMAKVKAKDFGIVRHKQAAAEQ